MAGPPPRPFAGRGRRREQPSPDSERHRAGRGHVRRPRARGVRGQGQRAPLAEGPTHESRAALRALPVEQRRDLRERLTEFVTTAADLARLPLQWIDDALAAVRGGTGDIWRARASELANGVARIDAVLEQLPAGVRVELPGDMDRMHAMATALEKHLGRGGALKTRADGTVKIGAFTPGVVKECRELLEQARVDGLPPTTVEASGC